MRNNLIHDINLDFSVTRTLVPESAAMDAEGLRTSERIDEVMMMCDRNQPVYEQISGFSIALYTLGFFDCPDLMAVEDMDTQKAAGFLREHFTQIRPEALPASFRITESRERYLLVVGDPLFPRHFAALVDTGSARPFFSKLPFFGAGFDSLEDLKKEFAGIDGVTDRDFYFFKKTWYGRIPPESVGKIYIVKD
ncbi:MAG: hypothetical protein ACOZBW_06570 [Thermodesulfobacteriota bacterium]